MTDPTLLDQLNAFFARFENSNDAGQDINISAEGGHQLTLQPYQVKQAFQKIDSNKAAGPDGVPGRELKACAAQLATVFTDIFNLSPVDCSNLSERDLHYPCTQVLGYHLHE